MRKTIFIILTLWVSALAASAQILNDSNLPIIVIQTDGGVPIPDEPKVLATMKIIWHPDGSRNYLTDIDSAQFLNYDGRIGIERRGSTSQQFFEKKPYSLKTLENDNTTNNNISLLGMPKEHDWVLNSLAFDETGMRDVLAYGLSESIGQYAPRGVYCEVMVNGDYKGLYVLMEKIKVDKNRVNIEKMDQSCNAYPEVTGGYITKADKTNGDPVAWTMEGYGGGWWPDYVDFIHHYPKPEDVTNSQNNYIHGVFNELASKSHSHDVSAHRGIPAIIDIPSFVDFMMIAEFSSNVDVYSLSTFFHKDRNGKLRAGPVWDYNLAFGYDAFGNRSLYYVWQFDNSDNNGPKFWKDLFDTDLFRCYMAKRWHELTGFGQPLSYLSITMRINAIDALITEAIGRDNQRWHKMLNHDYSVQQMKDWIQNRINWLNDNIGPYEGCADVDVPPLVISKIHYHPQDYWGISGDLFEFIEITNNGDEEVDLTGIYFRELGISYGFPHGTTLGPREALVLCSDSLAFRDYYNTTPFGQYTRTLSNKSQNLVLADAWGNVIDEVHYTDSLPWPPEADGNGPYLQLIDLDLDNSLPENWTLGDDLTDILETAANLLHIYPNPTHGLLFVEMRHAMCLRGTSYRIINLTGQTVLMGNLTAEAQQIDVSCLPSGVYIMELRWNDGTLIHRKIVKE